MARRLIRISRNDDLPNFIIQISNKDTGEVVDLSPSSTVITFKFRMQGADETIFEATATKVNAALGTVQVAFPANSLDGLTAGRYEGEVTVTFDGSDQTVQDIVKFRLKEDFVDA